MRNLVGSLPGGQDVSGFWSFGETAFGDQYAYRLDALTTGEDVAVYFLDGISMVPELIAPSFAEFLEREFLRNAREPYDEVMLLAHERFGPLEIDSHLVYVPSLLLGGSENVDNLQRMPSRAAMICNGDIAVQLDEGPPNGVVVGVEAFEDEYQRMRMRLLWK